MTERFNEHKRFNPYVPAMFLVNGEPQLIHPYAQATDKDGDGEPIPYEEPQPKAKGKSKSKTQETDDE